MLTSIGRVTGLTYGRDDQLVPVDEFVDKPVDPASLVARVAALLARRGACTCS
jgi:DNA-binding response OmpR family regulator